MYSFYIRILYAVGHIWSHMLYRETSTKFDDVWLLFKPTKFNGLLVKKKLDLMTFAKLGSALYLHTSLTLSSCETRGHRINLYS